MSANLAIVPEGYSLQNTGRSGSVFFRKGARILELYCEMSGVPDVDMLLWIEESHHWTYPTKEAIPEPERTQILAGLEAWLRMMNIRTDAFPGTTEK